MIVSGLDKSICGICSQDDYRSSTEEYKISSANVANVLPAHKIIPNTNTRSWWQDQLLKSKNTLEWGLGTLFGGICAIAVISIFIEEPINISPPIIIQKISDVICNQQNSGSDIKTELGEYVCVKHQKYWAWTKQPMEINYVKR